MNLENENTIITIGDEPKLSSKISTFNANQY